MNEHEPPTNPQKLNFAALDAPKISRSDFTVEQLIAARLAEQSLLRQSIVPTVLTTIFVVYVLIIALPSLLHPAESFFTWVVSYVVFPFVITATIIVSIAKFHQHKYATKLRLLRFALDNGLQYLVETRPPFHDTIVLKIGHSPSWSNELRWPNDEMVLSDYQFITGSGRYSTTHYLSLAKVKLPRKVPHLFLSSKTTPILRSYINQEVYHIEKVKLEGDFSKHFELFIPPGYHVDTLQIFTPDVMAVLLDHGKEFNFELIDDTCYIYCSETIEKNPQQIRKLITIAELLSPQLGRQAKTYSDLRAGDVASGVVAPSGARLQRRRLNPVTITITSLIIILTFAISFSNPELGWYPLLTLLVVSIAFVVVGVVSQYWRGRS
jgi:hypothetical protein